MKKFYLIKKTTMVTKTLIDSDGKILERFDPEVTVISEETVPYKENNSVIHEITGSEAKFGFIAGKDLSLLECYPLGHDIDVHIFDLEKSILLQTHMHRSLRRRIDGFTKIYKELNIVAGTLVEVSIINDIIKIRKL